MKDDQSDMSAPLSKVMNGVWSAWAKSIKNTCFPHELPAQAWLLFARAYLPGNVLGEEAH